MTNNTKVFLVLNPGSSSEKFSLYEGEDEIASLYFEGIEEKGKKKFICTLTRADGSEEQINKSWNSLDVAFKEARAIFEKEGFTVTYLPVDSSGLVSVSDLLHEISPNTTLVSIMAVNNEVGTIEPIKEIAQIAHSVGAICFTDAVQAAGVLDIKVTDLGVDLMSISSHKIHLRRTGSAPDIRPRLNTPL